MPTAKPFVLKVSDETLGWITDRVKTARIIPDISHPAGKEWDHGTPSEVVEDLVEHWRTSYDWRKVERDLNATFNMFTMVIEEPETHELIDLHFVHHASSRAGAIPLLFAHGWPGNFTEVEGLLKLTEPEDPKAQAFHVIAPSLPGFTFSSPPKSPDFTVSNTARVYYHLMKNLGYHHFICQAGDWGSFVCRSIALQYPEACIGLHLNFMISVPPSPFRNPLTLAWLIVRWFSNEEKTRLGRMQWWMKQESGYSKIQGTKPQSIAYGLNDSPIGMLAWIREKLDVITDDDFVWEKDTVITWTILYLLSNNAGHARMYRNNIPGPARKLLEDKIKSEVAVGYSGFPKDVAYIPKWWAEATVAENIVFWREHTKGGHFPSVECPHILEKDIYDFVAAIPKERLLLCRA